SELVNTPAEVAASHRLEAISTSFTRASSVDLTALWVTTLRDLPFTLMVRGELFSLTIVLLGRQVVALGSSRKMPRLVPATRTPLGACFRLNTSRPPSPELFCCQCEPPSRETNTPPSSWSLITPT